MGNPFKYLHFYFFSSQINTLSIQRLNLLVTFLVDSSRLKRQTIRSVFSSIYELNLKWQTRETNGGCGSVCVDDGWGRQPSPVTQTDWTLGLGRAAHLCIEK